MTDSTDTTTQVHRGIKTPYEDLLCETLADGAAKSDRTSTGTRSVFGRQLCFGLDEGFPLIATEKVHLKSIVYELLWFLHGDSNARRLQDHGVTVWDEWADDDGDLGPVYGIRWRSWPVPDGYHIDQIVQVLEILKSDPDSCRNVVSAWNASEIPNMALPPYHLLFQLYVTDGRLSCQLHQHNADMFLGMSFNIVSHALLTYMTVQQAGLGVGEFIWIDGDCHVYDDHIEQCEPQVSCEPHPYPTLKLRRADNISDYAYEGIGVIGCDPHPLTHGQVAI